MQTNKNHWKSEENWRKLKKTEENLQKTEETAKAAPTPHYLSYWHFLILQFLQFFEGFLQFSSVFSKVLNTFAQKYWEADRNANNAWLPGWSDVGLQVATILRCVFYTLLDTTLPSSIWANVVRGTIEGRGSFEGLIWIKCLDSQNADIWAWSSQLCLSKCSKETR